MVPVAVRCRATRGVTCQQTFYVPCYDYCIARFSPLLFPHAKWTTRPSSPGARSRGIDGVFTMINILTSKRRLLNTDSPSRTPLDAACRMHLYEISRYFRPSRSGRRGRSFRMLYFYTSPDGGSQRKNKQRVAYGSRVALCEKKNEKTMHLFYLPEYRRPTTGTYLQITKIAYDAPKRRKCMCTHTKSVPFSV